MSIGKVNVQRKKKLLLEGDNKKRTVVDKSREVSNQSPKKWRLDVVLTILFMIGLVIGYRIVDLQVINRHFLQREGDKRAVRYESIAAHRGVIFDRNGDPLAVSTPVITIWAVPDELLEARERWPELCLALGKSEDWLAKKIAAAKDRDFLYLQRKMTPEESSKVEVLAIPGVHAANEQQRYYPTAEVTSHLVGFTDIDEVGLEGMELAYNEWLSGEVGQRRVLKDRKGRLIRQAELVRSASPGKELMLSIDLRLQYIAYRELKKAVDLHQAKAGSLVMLDVETGEVLAMVNQPSYNPNNRSGMKAYRMRNRSITDVMELGSALKPFTIAAALESGKFNRNTVINTSPGFMRVGKSQVSDTRNFGSLDVTEVLSKSSNVGVSKMALAIGADKLLDMFMRLGFGQSAGTGFPGENPGYIPYSDRLSDIEVANLSFGYGLMITPLQLAQAYMVLGTDGIMRPISLIKRVVVPEGIRVMDKSTAREVKAMLKAVVHKGSGRKAMVDAYEVGGKTGTTKKVINGNYSDDHYIGVFAGLAPVEKTRLAIVVVIDEPNGKPYYGGLTAAPVFSKVAAGALRILGVEPMGHSPLITDSVLHSSYTSLQDGLRLSTDIGSTLVSMNEG